MRNKKILSITLTIAFLACTVEVLTYGMKSDKHLYRESCEVRLEDKFYTSYLKPKIYYSRNSENKILNEELYNKAYEVTIKAVNEKNQSLINEARVAVEDLKGKVDWAIGEFSKQLDNVQNEIIIDIVEKIDMAKIAQTQGAVNNARNSITDDIPELWRRGFEYDLDKVQQKIIYQTLEAVLEAKESKTEEDINNAGELLGQLQNIEGDETVKNLIEKTRQDFFRFVQEVRTKNPTDEGKNENKNNSDLEEFLNAIKTYKSNKELKVLFDFEKLPLEKLQKYCKGEKYFSILRNIVSDINREKIHSRSCLEEVVEASVTKNIIKDRANRYGINIEIEETSKAEIDITNRIENLFKGLIIDYEAIEYGECRGLIYENKKILLEKDYLDYAVTIPIKLLEDSSSSDNIYVTVSIKEDERDEDYLKRLIENVPKYIEINGDSKYLKEEITRTIDNYLDERIELDILKVIKESDEDSLIDDSNGSLKINEKTYEQGRLGIQKVEIGVRSSRGNMITTSIYLMLQPEVEDEEDVPLNQIYFAKSKNQWDELVGKIINLSRVEGDIDNEVIDRVGQYICYTTNWVNMKKLKEVIPKINGIFNLKKYYETPIGIEINSNKKAMEKSLEEKLEYLKIELEENNYHYECDIDEEYKNNFITIENEEIIFNKDCDVSYNVSVEKATLTLKACEDYEEGFNITFLFHKEKISDLDRIIINVKLYYDEIINNKEEKNEVRERLKDIGINFKAEFEEKVLSYIKNTPNVNEKNLKEFIKSIDNTPDILEEFKELIKETDWNNYKGTVEEVEAFYENAELDISELKALSEEKNFNYKKALLDLNKKLKKEPLEDGDKTQRFIDEFIRLNKLKVKLYNNPIKLEVKGEIDDIDIADNVKLELESEDVYDISEIEGVKYPIKEIKDEKIIIDKHWKEKCGFKVRVKFTDETYEKEKGKATPTLELEVYLEVIIREEKVKEKPTVDKTKEENSKTTEQDKNTEIKVAP